MCLTFKPKSNIITLIILVEQGGQTMPQQLEKLQYKRQATQFQGIYIDDNLTIVKNNIAEVR